MTDAAVHDIHEESYSKTIFGFWVYLMTDCILFATLFATYAVLHNNTAGGASSHDLFSLPSALAETLILLTSSFTCGLALLASQQHNRNRLLTWLGVTFLLGAAFLAIELTEFYTFAKEGNSWARSAFLSSFFTLVGTHGLHITTGLVWIGVLIAQLILRGLTFNTVRRMACFALFWHFLDVIWVLIFTVVYLLGVK
jgi:cytochrome o ubiquinol oxidase subunit 3